MNKQRQLPHIKQHNRGDDEEEDEGFRLFSEYDTQTGFINPDQSLCRTLSVFSFCFGQSNTHNHFHGCW